MPSLAAAVDFSYSGFSTAGYAQSDTDDASVGYAAQPGGIDSSGDVTTDSKIGVQVSAKFNDLISATVQGVGYADMTGDWEPHLDWAYVRLNAMRNLSLRAGYPARADVHVFRLGVRRLLQRLGASAVWSDSGHGKHQRCG